MEKPKELEDWLTQLEAASLAGVTDRAINYYIRNKRLNAVKIGRMWLINIKDLREIYPKLKK